MGESEWGLGASGGVDTRFLAPVHRFLGSRLKLKKVIAELGGDGAQPNVESIRWENGVLPAHSRSSKQYGGSTVDVRIVCFCLCSPEHFVCCSDTSSTTGHNTCWRENAHRKRRSDSNCSKIALPIPTNLTLSNFILLKYHIRRRGYQYCMQQYKETNTELCVKWGWSRLTKHRNARQTTLHRQPFPIATF